MKKAPQTPIHREKMAELESRLSDLKEKSSVHMSAMEEHLDTATVTARGPGRPTSDPAMEHIHLRVSSARKAAYLRAAEPAKLSEWIFAKLDREAGYAPPG